MGLISSIKKHIRKQKEIRLAGLKAELSCQIHVMNQCKRAFPDVLAKLHRKIAELEKELSY